MNLEKSLRLSKNRRENINYLKANHEKFESEEIFLLRNLSKRGVKFFQTSGYYPDFIMWKRKKDKQTIAFIDPKGIRNCGNFNDDKIQLYKNIKDIAKNIKDPKVRLDSFILSVSKYNDIKKTFEDGRRQKGEFEENHIRFMEEKDSIEKLLKIGAID